jgi:hypothetical protein
MNGKVYFTGKLDNFHVHIDRYQVTIRHGSLCKYYFGDNYRALTCNDTKLALNMLSDALHLQISNAIVNRLDVGFSIIVDEPIDNYINHFGELKHKARLRQPHSLYYRNESGKEIINIYDKNREQQNHRNKVPELYQGKNIIRIEQRYMKWIPQLLGVRSVTGAMLYDTQFYNQLLDNWHGTYTNIEKIGMMAIDFKEIKTVRQLNTLGLLALTNSNGGLNDIIQMIAESKRRGDLSTMQAYCLKKAFKQACSTDYKMVVPSTTILELDDKVNDIVQQYKV